MTEPQGAGYPADTEAPETFLEEKIRAEGVPGLSVAMVQSDRIVWERGFGFADPAARKAAPATSYLWFSMTKIVTATIVTRLAEDGCLDLDAPADEYFQGFKVVAQPTPVTVWYLLSHSSGLANPLPIRWARPADLRNYVSSIFTKLQVSDRSQAIVHAREAVLGTRGDSSR
jgi:CubicO group peptidase (beta-lactamase class C family)